jgi:hypothetical protein
MGHLYHDHSTLGVKETDNIVLRSEYEFKNKELKAGENCKSRCFMNHIFSSGVLGPLKKEEIRWVVHVA